MSCVCICVCVGVCGGVGVCVSRCVGVCVPVSELLPYVNNNCMQVSFTGYIAVVA